MPLRYMIYFISFNVLTQGAGMGCECCCHCFIRHVKTSSHRNKLLSQHPGLITPRHSCPGEQGERGVLFIVLPNFSINIRNIQKRCLLMVESAWPGLAIGSLLIKLLDCGAYHRRFFGQVTSVSVDSSV